MANILVVDDDSAASNFVKRALEEEHNVLVTTNLVEVPDLLFTHNIELLLLDVNMPGISGDHLAKILKRSIHNDILKIVLFSGMDEYVLRQKALDVGADGYISKTFQSDLLQLRVKRYLP
jgi:DNA-binding response OmpR family regulator